MLRWLKPFCLIWLCLVLATGSVTMAVARGQSAALAGGGVIVICTGYGVTSITVDADGNPVGPVHPCPDCLAGLAAYISPAPATLPALTSRVSVVQSLPRPSFAVRSIGRTPPARGPPALI